MGASTQNTAPVETAGRVKVSATDAVYKWLRDALTALDGTITLTENTAGDGSKTIDIKVTSPGVIASTADELVKVKAAGTAGYLDTVLAVGTGLAKVSTDSTATLSLSASLKDLTDVNASLAYTALNLMSMDGSKVVTAYKLFVTGGAAAAPITNEATEVVTRKILNETMALCNMPAKNGTTDYTLSSMWRSKGWIGHEQMQAFDITASTVEADLYPSALDLAAVPSYLVSGTKFARRRAYTQIDSDTGGGGGEDIGALGFSDLVEEDWNDTDATPKIYLDIIVQNATRVTVSDVISNLKAYCHSFIKDVDLASFKEDTDSEEDITWAVLGAPGDRWEKYITFEFDATTLGLSSGYRHLTFDLVTMNADDKSILISGARLRYKKKVVDIRIADTLIITEP